MREALRAYKRHLVRIIYRVLQARATAATAPSSTITGVAPHHCQTS